MTLVKLPFVIKNFVLSIFEWSFYIGFTVCVRLQLYDDNFVMMSGPYFRY